ncbi:hypothetical protein [Sporosarcina koreensis]|uniref:hypothetical protein n=1 Tax=Sporosarcina koreensis TaxID=334735 RepID=UPI0011817FF5|nr:hypothetical protein [Sporosarcina koreensis]
MDLFKWCIAADSKCGSRNAEEADPAPPACKVFFENRMTAELANRAARTTNGTRSGVPFSVNNPSVAKVKKAMMLMKMMDGTMNMYCSSLYGVQFSQKANRRYEI